MLYKAYLAAIENTCRKTHLNQIPEAVEFKNFIENLPPRLAKYRKYWLVKFYKQQNWKYIQIANEMLELLRGNKFVCEKDRNVAINVIEYILVWFERARSEWITRERARIRAEYEEALEQIQRTEKQRLQRPIKQETGVSWRGLLHRAKGLLEKGDLDGAERFLNQALACVFVSLRGKKQQNRISEIQKLLDEIKARRNNFKPDISLNHGMNPDRDYLSRLKDFIRNAKSFDEMVLDLGRDLLSDDAVKNILLSRQDEISVAQRPNTYVYKFRI